MGTLPSLIAAFLFIGSHGLAKPSTHWARMREAFAAARNLEPEDFESNEVWEGGLLFSFKKGEVCRTHLLGVVGEKATFGLFELKALAQRTQDRSPLAIVSSVYGHSIGYGSLGARFSEKRRCLSERFEKSSLINELRAGTNHQGQPTRLYRSRYVSGDRKGQVYVYGYFDTYYYRDGDPNCLWAQLQRKHK